MIKYILICVLLSSIQAHAGKENELFIEIANESAELKVFQMLAEDVPIDELEHYANKLTKIDGYLTQIVEKYPSSDLALKVATKQTIGFVNIQKLRGFHDAIAIRVERKQCLDQPDLDCYVGVLRHHAVNNRKSIGSSPLAILVGVYISQEDVQTAIQLAKLIDPNTVKSWRLGKYISALGDNVDFSFYEDIANHYSEGRKHQFYAALHEGLRKLHANNSDRALTNMRSSDVISSPSHRDDLIEALSFAGYFQEAFELLEPQRADDSGFYTQSAKKYLYYKLSTGLNDADWHVAETLLNNDHLPFESPFGNASGNIENVILTQLNQADSVRVLGMMTQHFINQNKQLNAYVFRHYYHKLAMYPNDIDANLVREQMISHTAQDQHEALLSGDWKNPNAINPDLYIKGFENSGSKQERGYYSCELSKYFNSLGDDKKALGYLDFCVDIGQALYESDIYTLWSIQQACQATIAVGSGKHMGQLLRLVMLLSPKIDKDNSKMLYRAAHYCSGGSYYL